MPAIMTLGYGQGVLGGLLTLQSLENQFHEMDVTDAYPSERFHKSTIQGTVVALFSVGGLFGAISCIGLGDVLGRRRTIIIASVVQIIGALLMSSAFNFAQLIVSRVVLGLGVGGQLTTVIIWQSEISPASKRGVHVGTTGIFVAMGLTLALFVDLGMSFVSNSASWRLPFAMPILLCLPVIIFSFCLPESPRWLVRQGLISEAREVLAVLNDIDAGNERTEKDIKDVQLSLSIAGKGSFGQVFHMGCQRNFHRASLAAGGLILLQLTGVTSITYYSMYLLTLHVICFTAHLLHQLRQYSNIICRSTQSPQES
jgi:MFS family permease